MPVLDGAIRVGWPSWLIEAFLLEAIIRDALGDPAAAGRALERALDLAEADGALCGSCCTRPRPCSTGTPCAAPPTPPCSPRSATYYPGNRPASSSGRPQPPLQALSDREIRVLRYLPTHLSAPEIARELSVATSTVKTHMRNLYAKLGAHSRAEAVKTARALGLLAPSRSSADPARRPPLRLGRVMPRTGRDR